MSYHVVRPVEGYEAFTTPFMSEGVQLQVRACAGRLCRRLSRQALSERISAGVVHSAVNVEQPVGLLLPCVMVWS
jgi:hypothetical protein